MGVTKLTIYSNGKIPNARQMRRHWRKSESIEAAIRNLEQLDLPGTSLMSLRHLGSGILLKHAIAGEITDDLGR